MTDYAEGKGRTKVPSREAIEGLANVDPCLWTTRRRFGVAGGPDEIVLTDEGNAKAFAVGARVRRGQSSEALEALAAAGGQGFLAIRAEGARYKATSLGRFDQLSWGHLRSLGYVETIPPDPGYGTGDGVRLTDSGKRAAENGVEERKRLLKRCSAAASLVFETLVAGWKGETK